MSVILFILILSVLIFIHELGHFIFAKRAGARVDEFAIGFPPRIFAFKKGETTYAINLIPLGGYVKIFGEDPDEESLKGPDSSRSLVNMSRWTQAMVLIAGVLFNFVFAWFLFSFTYTFGFQSPVTNNASAGKITILSVLPDSPADRAGLTVGDKILDIGNTDKKIEPQSVEDVQNIISDSNYIYIDYERKGEVKKVEITPAGGLVENKNAIGIQMAKIETISMPFYKAIYVGFVDTAKNTYLTAKYLIAFIGKSFVGKSDVSELTGPIGIAGMFKQATKIGWAYVFELTAFISINLAVINILPFPALDGGRLFFLAIEGIRRKRISAKILNTANLVGFGLLIALMIFITYRDIINLW